MKQVCPLLAVFAAASVNVVAIPSLAVQAQEPRLDSAQSYPLDTNLKQVDETNLIAIPGTSISLVPPSGFDLADQFSGFIHPETFSSILLAELPLEAYAELLAILSASPDEITASFAQRGIAMDVEQVSTILVGDTQTPLVIGTQTSGSTVVKKYITLLQGESTILLTFNLMEPTQLTEAIVIETIESVHIAAAPSIQEKVATLPFIFQTATPFQVAEVIVGSSVVLTQSGELRQSEDQPLIIIASSLSPVVTTNLATLSRQLFRETSGFAGATITAQEPVEFAGGDGYLLQASSQQSAILQYLRVFPDGFYLRLVVEGDAEILETLMPAIQAIQGSVATR